MTQLRNNVIRMGLEALYYTGAHRLLRPLLSGVGTIFMLHHVRPARDNMFQPNRHLEITPEFLRDVLKHVRSLDVDIVSIDEVHRRLTERDFSRRFASFTFDDGYRDNRVHALPVMREFDAPMAVYVASDFAEGSGRLWWVALEKLLASCDTLDLTMNGENVHFDLHSPAEKEAAFGVLHDWLRNLPNDLQLQYEVSRLCARHGIDDSSIARDLCLSWDELKSFSADPLVTIGAHTISHCNLAHETYDEAEREMRLCRERIQNYIQKPVAHIVYPYGDKQAAAAREFDLARKLGFKTGLTTRPGMIFADNADHITALPRISLNGKYQSKRFLSVLTSGVATSVWNGFRRVDAA